MSGKTGIVARVFRIKFQEKTQNQHEYEMVVALQSSFKADYIATLLIFGFKYTLIKIITFSLEYTR